MLPRSLPIRAASLALCLASCATYTQRTEVAMAHFEAGELEQARAEFEDPATTGSDFLGAAESGTVALVQGDWTGARERLESAAALVRELEDRALVSAGELGESLISFAINDTVKTYEGEGYERVMLHVLLAMTYLAEGHAEGAWVEAKRANRLLESEETLYEKRYAAGGMGHYLSAVAYELVGEPGEAYIDYKRMQEKGVGLDLAGRALVRLGTQLGREDELPLWTERFGPDVERPQGAASVVLLAGLGVGPYKVESGFSIPLPQGVVQWAVPSFVRRPQPITALELVELRTGTRVGSALVEDLGQVAQENLDDRIAWLAAKSAVRAALKFTLTRELQKEHGAVGWIAGALFTVATERADLRSWLTLPDAWHGARMFLAPGEHELAVQAVGGERVALGTYAFEPGETMIVLVRAIGRRLHVQPLGGRRIEPGDPGAVLASGADHGSQELPSEPPADPRP
ncbi:MAG TPA: hypothetical protein VMT18_15665 [Planctomycetota bacterium]|nr:hypothetical protein [Planctomycetota bacterium]